MTSPVPRAIRAVGVVGLGTMGAGIAQVCATAGIRTIGYEPEADRAQRGRDEVQRQLDRAVAKEKIDAAERDRVLGLLETSTDLGALAGCDLVIEAVVEDLAVKRELFARLQGVVAPDAILATNTSAISVTAIAAAVDRPERVVGMHFFNPAAVLPLVEVVRAELSSPEAVEATRAFAERIGKQPIVCRDTPGFVVNRVLIPSVNEAVRALDEGVADAEAIDLGMRLGTNWPIGPLALIDLIGVDVWVHVCDVLWDASREPQFLAPSRLRRMVEAGLLGRKRGRGFYGYAS